MASIEKPDYSNKENSSNRNSTVQIEKANEIKAKQEQLETKLS